MSNEKQNEEIQALREELDRIQGRIGDLNARIDKANDHTDNKYASLRMKITKAEAGLKKQISHFDPKETTKFLIGLKDDCSSLHKRLQAMTLRMTVSTELCRTIRDPAALVRMIQAFDYYDEWWRARESWTIEAWRQYFVKGESVRKSA